MKIIKATMLIGLTPFLMCADVATTNLLTNPGAESGITGWSSAYGAGVDAGTFDPGINPLTGSYDFYGGLGYGYSYSELYQTDDIITQGVTTGEVNAGSLYANVSFAEQGLNQGAISDDARIALAFLDSSNQLIVPSNPVDYYYNVTPEVDSHGGLWTRYTESFLIPADTVKIVYYQQFILHQGTNIDSFIDDNSLIVSSTYAAPTSTLLTPSVLTATPEPSLYGIMFAGIAGLGVAVRRRNRKADAR